MAERRRYRHGRRNPKGAAAVEFALVFCFILLPAMFGMINFGVVFAQDLALSNSARQAARYGVVDDRSCEDIIDEARKTANSIAMHGSDTVKMQVHVSKVDGGASVCPTETSSVQPCKGSPVGTNIYVRVEFDTTALVPLVPVPDKIDGRGMFRCEFS